MELRDYQKDLIEELRYLIAGGSSRICAVAPCGAGKTVLFSWITGQVRQNKQKILIVVHRQELIEQTSKTLDRFYIPHEILNSRNINSCQVHVASVYTLAKRLNQFTEEPGLIILDEAHHAVANTWKKLVDRFNKSLIIGFTATPARLSGDGLGAIFQKLALGPSVTELIEMGSLSPYDYYAPPVKADLEGIRVKYGDYQRSEIALRMDKSEIIGDAIETYKRLAMGKRAICYCASRIHAEHVANEFNKAGIPSAYIDGETPDPVRKAAIDQFRSGTIKILTNVDLISEGFDVPDMEAVILLRPTQSTCLFIQQAMRAMRADPENPGKRAIIIDHVGNVYRHGLPDEDREWSLEGKVKKRDPSEIKIRQCPKCFFTHKPRPVCPKCGHVYAKQEAEVIEERKAGELLQIKDLERKKQRREVAQARTREDLEMIAFKRGYSLRWIDKMLEVRGRSNERTRYSK
ncbi:DEAD/DEAH box helicase family protein [Dehalobacter sp.]|uniref:DEAD/DEAH box helicase n=1 Tax=Dehalobacter sp. TaxID=1962289 RepID=UPI002584CACC|nr:DEAD/DEAH box helicase family protein [Dehalobacter sp.]MDJ0305372.1 DEAD/DEAH box helicase family protein [Dehalobacter sp.]